MKSGGSSFWRIALTIVCCLGLTTQPAAAQETEEEPQEKVTEEITVTPLLRDRSARTRSAVR